MVGDAQGKERRRHGKKNDEMFHYLFCLAGHCLSFTFFALHSPTAATHNASFIPKGVDGVEARSLPGGIETKDHAHTRGDDHRGDDGAYRRRRGPVERLRDEHGGAPSYYDAHEAAGRQSAMASVRNWRNMSFGSAPTAMRRPISRVLSVTETSMMFMMPTPPTMREIMAT